VALGIAGIISSVLIPLLGLYYTSRDKEREVAQGFVEVATKILSDKPTDDNKPLREWAISLIDNYSAVPLPAEARNALLNNQQIFVGPNAAFATSRAGLRELEDQGLTVGISVSHFNGSINFSMVAERGIRFAFIKASQGESFVDAEAPKSATAAHQAGLKVGLYHFFIPTGDVEKQFAISQLG
jgi:hypothetical protein